MNQLHAHSLAPDILAILCHEPVTHSNAGFASMAVESQ